jgi:hypothetical protein
MNRRPRLPGADELFRSTGPSMAQPASPLSALTPLAPVSPGSPGHHPAVIERTRADRPANPERVVSTASDGAALGRLRRPAEASPFDGEPDAEPGDDAWSEADGGPSVPAARIGRRTPDARPTGRERHDEKITVYCSPEELLQIERARLTLRGSHGLAVDRGRIMREAIAVVLADLEAKGESSILVRRLRGR